MEEIIFLMRNTLLNNWFREDDSFYTHLNWPFLPFIQDLTSLNQNFTVHVKVV